MTIKSHLVHSENKKSAVVFQINNQVFQLNRMIHYFLLLRLYLSFSFLLHFVWDYLELWIKGAGNPNIMIISTVWLQKKTIIFGGIRVSLDSFTESCWIKVVYQNNLSLFSKYIFQTERKVEESHESNWGFQTH